ncbi:MAG: hypothetical protein Q4B60_07300 [Erysipelotrichaceae bacterium]|nr:hypothetical protein [Erysipelotrichaceae bacterium]
MKKTISKIMILLLSALVLFYIMLPAINIHDPKFYVFVFILLIEALLLSIPSSVMKAKSMDSAKFFFLNSSTSKITKVIFSLIIISLVYAFGCKLIYAPIFNANKYANRIQVENVEFSSVPAYNFNTTAIIDRSSASLLGDKVMGNMTDLVSQFVVSNEYSQISYKEGTYRATPLAYDGFIKYFKNKSKGVPGYIVVNTTTGETKLERLEEGMKYVPSSYFNTNLYRKLRFNHPFEIFGNPTFEIDEEGHPYYVCTTYTYKGISSLRRVTGVVLFDPIDGSSKKYSVEEAPTWIDRIYPESLVLEELNNYGIYKNGWLNSFIGQEGVIQTSDGYNYISKDGDIWLYTGMTSIVSDESNVGFCLVNLRTHEANYIATTGASEYAAMSSAEGEVLNYGYVATFPVLVNINDKPTYILSLKDSAGLVKMYALVDAQDYQQVYTTKASSDAKTSIENLILTATGHKVEEVVEFESFNKDVYIAQIKQATIEGNTYLYLSDGANVYVIKVDENNAAKALFIEDESTYKITYHVVNNQNIVDEFALN